MNDSALYLDAPGPNIERQAKLFALLYSASEVEDRVMRIYEATLAQSPQIREGNFTVIGTDDLERLFFWYDREFFRGRLGEMILEDEAHPMAFRLSRRLVSAAGQTIRQVRRVRQDGKPAVKVDYEITISTTLLYNTFQNVERTVTVGGLVCRDRLESLQRIFEHELLHLAEFLGWGRSNCRADNFHALSRRIFAHEGAFHDLITPREQARAAFNIHVGDHVSFELDGSLAHRTRQPDHSPRDRAGREPRRQALLRRQALCHLLRAATALAKRKPGGLTPLAHGYRAMKRGPCHLARFGRSWRTMMWRRAVSSACNVDSTTLAL